MPSHRVNSLEIEVSVGDEELGQALLDRLSGLRQDRVAPLLDRVFGELSPPDRLDRLDRLELELGELPAEGFDAAFVERLEEALRRALGQRLRAAAEPDRRPTELLRTYALSGALPWWAERRAARPVGEALIQALRGAELLALLRSVGDDPAALRRLAAACEAKALAEVAEAVWPGQGEGVRALEARLNPAGRAGPRALLGAALLQAVVVEESSENLLSSLIYNVHKSDPELRAEASPGAEGRGPGQVSRRARALRFVRSGAVFLLRGRGEPLVGRGGVSSPAGSLPAAGALPAAVSPPAAGSSSLAGSPSAAGSPSLAGSPSAAGSPPAATSPPRAVSPPLAGPRTAAGARSRAGPSAESPSARSPTPAGARLPAESPAPGSLPAGQAPSAPPPAAGALVGAARPVAPKPQPRPAEPRYLAERRRRALAALEQIFVDDAGLVLLWPFIERFFARLGLTDADRAFPDEAARAQAVALLSLLVHGDPEPPEWRLVLPKLLCGLSPEEPLPPSEPLSEAQLEETERLLQAVIAHATILGELSVDGFRGGFLRREGALSTRGGAWLLRVERAPYDLVLDRFPWSWSWIRLPWMPESLQVEW